VFLQENCVYETVVLPLDEETFEKTVTPIVQEYFEHGDANEVAVRFMTVLLNEETAFALSYLIAVMQSSAIISMSKQACANLGFSHLSHSVPSGTACRAEPEWHARRRAHASRIASAGGESKPQGADVPTAQRALRARTHGR